MTDAADDEHNQNPQPDGGAPEPDDTVRSTESQASPSISPNSVEGLFLHALQMTSTAERDRFLDNACDDKERRQRVTALLRAYEDAGSFLEEPASGPRHSDEVSLSFLKPIDKAGVLGTIGPYEVLDVIGRGGMGVVLRAVDLKLNRIVAVKVLLPELAANPNSRRRFLREAQAAAAISHPQVVTIHAVDDSHEDANGKPVPPYLVMECVVGQSLQQKLDRVGTLRLAEILRIGRQIGEGLAAAHKQGVIHRDIKPANILLENGVERVKITDFGLARAIDDITVTRTGEVSGTPQYMSPEQACGERVDHRSDLFSLGCVMYAICTGHSPFRGDSIAHVIKRVTQDTPRPIADQNPEIPPWLIQIITCLLQKDPEQRFQSAEGVVAILDQHLSRIQHPTESGSHSAINQQVPVADAAPPFPDAKTRDTTVLRDTRTLNRIIAAGIIAFAMAKVFLLAVPEPQGTWMIVLLVAGITIYSRIKSHKSRKRLAAGTDGLKSAATDEGLNQATLQPAVKHPDDDVPMPSPEAKCSESAGVQSHIAPWLLLRIPTALLLMLPATLGAVLGFGLRPRFSLDQQTDSVYLVTYLTMFAGIWVAQILLRMMFHRSKFQLRPYALLTGALMSSFAVGWSWTTVLRIQHSTPFEWSPESLAVIGLLPTIIWGLYCVYVGRELDAARRDHSEQQSAVPPGQFQPKEQQLTETYSKQAALQSAIRKWWLPVVAIVCVGCLAYRASTQQSSSPQTVAVDQLSEVGSAVRTMTNPIVILKHPNWGEIRTLMVNRSGSSISKSHTETKVYLRPEMSGTAIQIHVILLDGREWRTYFDVNKPETEVVIEEWELQIRDQSLVEVLDDSPEAKLRGIAYPSQKISANAFSISEAPFHKALQPGEHKIILDYVLHEWDVPEGYVQYNKLDYRVTVPDTNPIQLSLKAILAEHGDEAETRRVRWDPDFRPLPKDGDKAAEKTETSG